MTKGTKHLISYQQIAGSLTVPITHEHRSHLGTVISAPDDRWGMRSCVSCEVKGETEILILNSLSGFLLNKSINQAIERTSEYSSHRGYHQKVQLGFVLFEFLRWVSYNPEWPQSCYAAGG